MRNRHPPKRDTKRIRQVIHPTRAPRLEGVVKNAMMQPVRKKKALHAGKQPSRKIRGYSDAERKAYQLRSRHH